MKQCIDHLDLSCSTQSQSFIPMTDKNRRKFIRNSSLALAAAATATLTSCKEKKAQSVEAPYINFNKTFKWKMVTTWPPNFPVLGEGCKLMAKWISTMSGGRMEIEVYGGGELIPSLESFDAVSHGAVEMASGSGYYWAGKIPAAQLFSSIPFGMNSQSMNAWILNGGGLDLWKELYAPFNLIPLPGGNTGSQAGGWYNKEINSIEDYKGLKIRMPGIGGKVINKIGGTSVLVAGSELYTNLERGVIDATEWIGPYHDYKMGFHRVAKNYYFPGWHEPGTVLETTINRSKFESLPADLQKIIVVANDKLNHWMLLEFETQNAIYLEKIKTEGVNIKRFPNEVIYKMKELSKEVLHELVETNEPLSKIYHHFSNFEKKARAWKELSQI
ncbi:TRAP transporter substrate-binding protein [Reichenbachiella versicolor]|uniref:TRAP transporter substrate-binding protein n=1 Tax=Reichenbachiella versicolor TaxID=1821036 RepID=UPI001C872F16|nr:TRAP transporter substrate-binding protein [Reichenbachiella versicolor]